MEMEVYRERLRTGQIATSAAAPLGLAPAPQVSLADLNSNAGAAACNEASSDKSNMEGFESGGDKDSEECSQAEAQLKNVDVEVVADGGFDLERRVDGEEKSSCVMDEGKMLCEGGISVPVEGIEQEPPSFGNDESVGGL